jgi:hypothetical protein
MILVKNSSTRTKCLSRLTTSTRLVKMVHYVGGHIVPEHWVACKATLVFHAGSTTSKLATMTKINREKATLESYNSVLSNLDPMAFKLYAIAFLRHSFREKDKPMTGDALYRYYLDSRNAMRSLILPLFPTDFSTMKSGEGFQKSVNAAFTKMYRKDLTCRTKDRMTIEQADQEIPPTYWEYKKKPWYFGLAVKVFRRDPHLAPNVNDVADDAANLPVSRAALKRKSQYKSHGKTMESDSIPKVVVVDVDAESEKAQTIIRKKASVTMHIMNSNLTIRMGQMQELKESMNFLDRMRGIIGDKVYTTRAKKLMACLPDPESYTTEVTSTKELVTAIKTDHIEEEDENNSILE